jgi:arabinofuranosyltransferase
MVGAWSYRWVQEDAFIDFRIIGNLLAGHGPVYNLGERVEVYSNPLWIALLAGLHEVLPFVSVEWLALDLGLVGTATGFVLAGRAVQRLGRARHERLVLPVGLLIASVVAGVWEFSTSGLEMGLVFAWLGGSYWLLVRTEAVRRSAVTTAFVIGLGPLIRPELATIALVNLVALGLIVAAPGWSGPAGRWRRYGMPLVAALALPVLYELWRAAYFALVVSNTTLAKDRGSGWAQGFTYLWDFVAPYTLWLPFVLVLPFAVPKVRAWWRAGDRTGVVLLVAPVVAGVVDALLVVHLGGDYMADRLLLPAFLSACLPLSLDVAQLRTALVVPAVGIAVWALVCGGWLRPDAGPGIQDHHGIGDERAIWITVTGDHHPIMAADYRNASAVYYRNLAARGAAQGIQQLSVITDPTVLVNPTGTRPARSPLPFHLAVNVYSIGVTGYVSGPDVYLFDQLSLANPVGAHVTPQTTGRPTQRTVIGPAWMIGRFGVPGTPIPPGGPSPTEVAAARQALACGRLASYLHSITAPLTPSLALHNLWHALGNTTLTFSPVPAEAERQLCGGGPSRAVSR